MAYTSDDKDPLQDGALAIAVNTGDALIATGVFSREPHPMVSFQASVVLMLMATNDLLQRASRMGARVDWREGIPQAPAKADVTDVISWMRNAACHTGSNRSVLDGNRFVFNVLRGKGVKMKGGDAVLECEYDDDLAVFFGSTRIYLHRQLIAAFNDAKLRLMTDPKLTV
jgi:hypothetical protein